MKTDVFLCKSEPPFAFYGLDVGKVGKVTLYCTGVVWPQARVPQSCPSGASAWRMKGLLGCIGEVLGLAGSSVVAW